MRYEDEEKEYAVEEIKKITMHWIIIDGLCIYKFTSYFKGINN